MTNNPWIIDTRPTEDDADSTGFVEVAFINYGELSLTEKLGVQLYNKKLPWNDWVFLYTYRPWRHTSEWIDKNSIEGIKETLNSKLDKIQEEYLEKSSVFRTVTNNAFEKASKRQKEWFEYAKLHGMSYPTITVGGLYGEVLTASNAVVSLNTTFNNSSKSKGYWLFGDFRIYSDKVPNLIARTVARLFNVSWRKS